MAKPTSAAREKPRANLAWIRVQEYPADTEHEWCYSHMGVIPRGSSVVVVQQNDAPPTTFCGACARRINSPEEPTP